ncbi:MAG TPA: ABC transporter permease [Bryobacteraceae bacterium]|nr:ABC transporter permease [Bryobacteraceae bacterium]
MSIWSRIANVFRPDRLSREIDEELQSHLEEAIEQGRDLAEARRAFGSPLQQRERSRDVRILTSLDSLRADTVFGWRQLRKNRVTSAAAILSLALAIGACTAAFRLIDALLLRPLPVADPDRLFVLVRQGIGQDGQPQTSDSFDYPAFRQLRAAVKDQAELIAISFAGFSRMDVTYGSGQEMEKTHLQYVSGWMFNSLGLRPALGRLLSENDDLKPGAHPVAVLSHDYWSRRFGQDPRVIGRTFRLANDGMMKTSEQPSVFQIVGVAPEGFTGTEPGTVTDIFVPTMMFAGATRPDWVWFRTFVRLKPGIAFEPVRDRLRATFRAVKQDKVKSLTGRTQQWRDLFMKETVELEPAAAGVSGMQRNYRVSLTALAVLVALVLLIACANVANLMTAQAAARTREMALRASIGAGRWRLVQLVLVESAWLAVLAAAIGGALAWWSAPLVVRMTNPSDNPARLVLPADWRVLGFGLVLTFAVTILFGLAPALRSSAIKPFSALKGGDDPHSRRRLMHALIAVQVAFCFLVLFVAGLFVGTFERLAHQRIGFSAERILTLNAVAETPQSPALWDQIAARLRQVPGVEKVALAGWPLLSGIGWDGYISIEGAPPAEDPAGFLNISPGWTDAMRIPLIDGRDFRSQDTYPGVAIVNEAFAKRYFNGANPVGKSFDRTEQKGQRIRLQIVGLVRDARYGGIRGPFPPVVYVPFHSVDAHGAFRPTDGGAIIVRTSSANPLALASILRQEVQRARPEFRVSNIRTQEELIQSLTIRERLLATLALFFGIVALLLAGTGLYGVLDYSVLQRRREIGIRMAIGAQATDIARRVTTEVFIMVLVGAVAGLALGMVSVRYIESLFFQVKATDVAMLVLPSLTIVAAASLAALPAVIRAIRIDPVQMLRTE